MRARPPAASSTCCATTRLPAAGRVAFAAAGVVALGLGLFVLFAAARPALARSGAGWRRLTWASAAGLAGLLAFAPIDPPANVVHSVYREAEARGEVDWIVRTPLPYSPNDAQRDAMAATGRDARLTMPGAAHPLGTDLTGQDVLSRMIHATRIAPAIGLIATGIAVAIGIVVGGLMGYFAGLVDLLGMRLVEVFSAIPVLYLLIMIVAFYGRSLTLMMVVIGLTGWVGYALFIRAEFLKLRSMDYVTAARCWACRCGRFCSSTCCPTASRPCSCSPASASPRPSSPSRRCRSWAWAWWRSPAGASC